MKQDAKVTHQSNAINAENGMEAALEFSPEGGKNAASVSGAVAGREALRSMALDREPKRKKSELTTGD